MDNLRQVEAWMQAEIAPQAQAMDTTAAELFNGFKGLGDRNLLAPRLSSSLGGLGWSELTYSQFQILIASYSGALAFLSTQHHSAVNMIGNSPNHGLRDKLLPLLISGEMGCGVGFSQLRRSGDPLMTAVPQQSGYMLSGTVPWVTGLGCFDGFICGATLADGQILMGWVPLTTESDPRLRVSKPFALAAMDSTQTAEITLKDWPLDATQVVAVHGRDWLSQKDQGNTLYHGFYALGSAKAALKVLMQAAQTLSLDPAGRDAIAAFQADYQACESQMLELLPHRRRAPERCLRAKAAAIHLAGRCSHAAIAISGGGANSRAHAAQRIYREVLAFTVFGQTPAAKMATLSALSFSASSSSMAAYPFLTPASGD